MTQKTSQDMSETGQADLFVPPDFAVPDPPACGDLRLVPLGPEHNARDYQAWTSSMEHIRRTPGFEEYPWPHLMTSDENMRDLRQHAHEFAQRTGFTYSVMNHDDDVVGCVYIYPSRRPGWADVRSWVRADHAALDADIYRTVKDWLDAEWPFDGVFYSPRGA